MYRVTVASGYRSV